MKLDVPAVPVTDDTIADVMAQEEVFVPLHWEVAISNMRKLAETHVSDSANLHC